MAFNHLLKNVQGDVLRAMEVEGLREKDAVPHSTGARVVAKTPCVGHPAYFGVGALRLLQDLIDARPRLFALLKLVQNLLRLLALGIREKTKKCEPPESSEP